MKPAPERPVAPAVPGRRRNAGIVCRRRTGARPSRWPARAAREPPLPRPRCPRAALRTGQEALFAVIARRFGGQRVCARRHAGVNLARPGDDDRDGSAARAFGRHVEFDDHLAVRRLMARPLVDPREQRAAGHGPVAAQNFAETEHAVSLIPRRRPAAERRRPHRLHLGHEARAQAQRALSIDLEQQPRGGLRDRRGQRLLPMERRVSTGDGDVARMDFDCPGPAGGRRRLQRVTGIGRQPEIAQRLDREDPGFEPPVLPPGQRGAAPPASANFAGCTGF